MWVSLELNVFVTILFGIVLPTDVPLNLFIGTGGEGYGVGSIPPGVQVPFGIMRLSPDTSYDNVAIEWNHFGGYHHGDNEIRCFSHTHMVGAGVTDYGNIGVTPVREINEHVITDYGYRSKFDHQHENATAGYYSVELKTHSTLAELTVAGPYTGVHKYTFHDGNNLQNIVILDPSHTITKDACVNASIMYDEDSNEFTGWTLMKGSLTGRNGRGIYVYFVANFSEELSSFGTWNDGHVSHNSVSTAGRKCGAFAEFDVAVSSVVMTISLSFVSINHAKMNREYDLKNCWTKPGDGFSNCVYFSQAKWSDVFNQVTVETVDSDDLTKFFTALYHVFTVPTKFSEVGGYYKGMDDKIHQITDGSNHYSDLSLWDIHRTQTSLLTLLQPNVSLDIVKSLIRMYQDGGALPRWPIANVYSGCMIANHANQVILDNLVKQNGAFDVSTAYQAMKEQATKPDVPHVGRAGLKEYITDGYCPSDIVGSSVSLTLAYAYDDWAVSEVAKYLRNTSEAIQFYNRSKNYRNVWNEDDQLMCPRNSSGHFSCPVDPYLNSWVVEKSAYTEGNAGQWRWFVPHDIPGLVGLFKSKEFFISELDKFFSRSEEDPYNILPNPYYWAGNEPDLLAVYLFNYVGRADLTQKYSRWLVENKYTTAPSGIPGNDDYGTMSAWYVWSVLGLYPLTGTDMYFIGSPVVNSATLKLHKGDFMINAYNNSKSNIFVKEVKLNGVNLMTFPFLHHTDIVSGGKLEFWMTSK